MNLVGSINAENIKKLLEATLGLLQQDQHKKVNLLINTHGGECAMGFGFYDLVRTLNVDLTTVGMGDVSSMGLILFLAGKERIITPNCIIYLHKISHVFEKSMRFTDSDIKGLENLHRAETDLYLKVVRERTNGKLSTKNLKRMMREERVLSAADAVKFGFADRVAEVLDTKL